MSSSENNGIASMKRPLCVVMYTVIPATVDLLLTSIFFSFQLVVYREHFEYIEKHVHSFI